MLKHKLKLNWNILFFTEKHIPKILHSRNYLTFKKKRQSAFTTLSFCLLFWITLRSKIKCAITEKRKTKGFRYFVCHLW